MSLSLLVGTTVVTECLLLERYRTSQEYMHVDYEFDAHTQIIIQYYIEDTMFSILFDRVN